MAALTAVFGEGVEQWPPSGEWSGLRYSAAEWGAVIDPDGVEQPGYHVGLWVHASREDAALAWSLGATVREEPDLEPWWPRLG
jgi:hypothetical protein